MRFKYMLSVVLLGVIVPMVLCQHDSMRSRGNRRSSMISFSRSSRGPPSRQNDQFGPPGRRQPINIDSRSRSSRMRPVPRSRSEIIIEFRNNNKRQNSNQGRFSSRSSLSDSRGRMQSDNFNGLDMPQRQTRRNENQIIGGNGRQSSRFNDRFPIDGPTDFNNIGQGNHMNSNVNGFNDHRQNAFGNDQPFPNSNAGIINSQMSNNRRGSNNNHVSNNHHAPNTHHASNSHQGSNNRHVLNMHHASNNHLNSGPIDINLPSEVLGSVNAIPVNTKGGNIVMSGNIHNVGLSDHNGHNSGFTGLSPNNAGSSVSNLHNAGISKLNGLHVSANTGHNAGIPGDALVSGLLGNSGTNIGSSVVGSSSLNVNKSGLPIQNAPNIITGGNAGHILANAHAQIQQNGAKTLGQIPASQGINQPANIVANTGLNPSQNGIHGDLHQLKHLLNEVLGQQNGNKEPQQGVLANTNVHVAGQHPINNNLRTSNVQNTQTAVLSKNKQGHIIQQPHQGAASAIHKNSQTHSAVQQIQTNINQANGNTVGNAINTLNNIIGGSGLATGNLAKTATGHSSISNGLPAVVQPRIEPIEIDYEEILQRAMTNKILFGLN